MKNQKQNKISKFNLVEDNKIPSNGQVFLRSKVIIFPKFVRRIFFRIDIIKANFIRDDQNPDMESDKILEKEKKIEKKENVYYEWNEDGKFKQYSWKGLQGAQR